MKQLAWVVVLLMAATAVADDAVPPAAEIERGAALTASKAGSYGKAIAAADKMVKLAPSWAEAYRTRAGIHVAAAGPDGETLALKTPVTGVDYKAIAKHLAAASADLKKYTELSPTAPDHSIALELVGELRMRGELATAAAKSKVKAPRCLDGQSLVGGRCRGKPSYCKTGQVYDPTAETCACMAGTVATDDGRCCWPNQVAGASGCKGTPQCPAGTVRDDALETCLPEAFGLSFALNNNNAPVWFCQGTSNLPVGYVSVSDELVRQMSLPPAISSSYNHWYEFILRYPMNHSVINKWSNGAHADAISMLVATFLKKSNCDGTPLRKEKDERYYACCKR